MNTASGTRGAYPTPVEYQTTEQWQTEHIALLEKRVASLESTLTDALFVLADLARLTDAPSADVLEASEAWQSEDPARPAK